jgi:hypothetical protein
VWFRSSVLDPLARLQFVELARGWRAAGAPDDEVLGRLRQNGLGKIDCIAVLHDATGLSLVDAKRAVHDSPAWADRREQDDALGDALARMAFIECVLGGGRVDEPDESAADCRDRQARAATLLRAAAAGLPEDALAGFREAMADDKFGAAFAALVTVGQRRDMPDRYWAALSTAAQTLCLYELLDLVGDDERPGDDAWADVRAARVVRSRTRSAR